jgi:hypothetical protein
MPWSHFWTEWQHQGVRWSLCAKDICFRNELLRCGWRGWLGGRLLRGGWLGGRLLEAGGCSRAGAAQGQGRPSPCP